MFYARVDAGILFVTGTHTCGAQDARRSFFILFTSTPALKVSIFFTQEYKAERSRLPYGHRLLSFAVGDLKYEQRVKSNLFLEKLPSIRQKTFHLAGIVKELYSSYHFRLGCGNLYIVRKVSGYVLTCREEAALLQKGRLDFYDPPAISSKNWKNWITHLDPKACPLCRSKHGQIYEADAIVTEEPPLHPNCRCVIEWMQAVVAGQGTKDGKDGADWWIKYLAILPDNYITKDDLYALGWRDGKSPAKYAPDKMIAGGIFENRNGHLPQVSGRIWYEADINYYSGRRNNHRLLWSNDGLIFVTYDHYETFIEIV